MESGIYEMDLSKDNTTIQERGEVMFEILKNSKKLQDHGASCEEKNCEICIKIDFLTRVFVYNQKLQNKKIDIKKLFEEEGEILDEFFFGDKIMKILGLLK